AWIMVDDPQILGEAVMLGGFVTYISRSPDRLSLLLAALLIVLGGFIKHNLVAIPLAITLDLAIRSPRQLLFWLACCAGLASRFEGTYYNMFQDAAVFLGIAAGVTFYELRKRICRGGPIHGRFTAIFLGIMLLFLAQPIFARSTDAFLRIYDSGGLLEFNRRA